RRGGPGLPEGSVSALAGRVAPGREANETHLPIPLPGEGFILFISPPGPTRNRGREPSRAPRSARVSDPAAPPVPLPVPVSAASAAALPQGRAERHGVGPA